jgi:hypothetical protein
MDYSLAKLSLEYEEINRDKSPTLNSLYICKKNGNLTYKKFLSPIIFESFTSVVKDGDRENYLNKNSYIIYEYLKTKTKKVTCECCNGTGDIDQI